jgi:hypothetical protein
MKGRLEEGHLFVVAGEVERTWSIDSVVADSHQLVGYS